MIDLASRLVFWTVVYLGAARIGAWVTRSDLRGLGHLAWDGLAGLPMLMAGWLVLGLVRFDRPSIAGSFVAFCALAALRTWRDPISRFGRPDRSTSLALGLMLATIVVGLLWNRVPVLFYDSLAYHFAQPESWILEGRIAPYDWSLHSWFPPGMSVLYGVGLLLGGEAWANDANLMLGLALLLVAFDLARRQWNANAGVVAVGALLCVPQTLFALAIPAADLAHGTFVAAALGALLLATAGDRTWSRRAAWITGGALLTKYLGLLIPLLVGFLFTALNCKRGTTPARRVTAAALFCLPGLLLLAPWLVANTVTVGNPVAPVASSRLAVDGLAPGGEAAFTRDARGGLPDTTDLRALGPRLLAGSDSGIYPSPAWGWPFLVWVAVALVGAALNRRVRLALSVAGLLLVVWFTTYRWERFLLPVTFFVCLALAGTLGRWFDRDRVGRLLAVVVLLLGAAYVPRSATAIARYSGGASVFLGREAPLEFVRRSWPPQRLLENDALDWNPETDRLLLVGEMRHFRIPVPRSAPTGFNLHPLAVELDRALSVEQAHENLRRRGFTHLLIDFDWVERSGREYPSLAAFVEDPTKFRSYVTSLGAPLATDGRRSVFAIPEQR